MYSKTSAVVARPNERLAEHGRLPRMPKARWIRIAKALTLLLAAATIMVGIGRLSRRAMVPERENGPELTLLDEMELLDTGEEKLHIGPAEVIGNLAVFPIFTKEQHDSRAADFPPDSSGEQDRRGAGARRGRPG